MKRVIYFSLVTILILMGCSKSDDLAVNPNENQLKSATPDHTVPMYYSEAYPSGKLTPIPVMCDGIVIDHLEGKLDAFCRMFGNYHPDYPKGTPGDLAHFQSEWMIHNYSGTLTATSGSGEVFNVQGTKKMDMGEMTFTFHLNIRGSLGNHYILFASGTNAANPLGYTFTIEKAVCPQSAGEEE
jgi:hypothetical protein